jgi:beta-glucanase (GH16 family)
VKQKLSLIFIAFPLIVLIGSYRSQTWILVWSDEFNGPSVDTTNWVFDIGTGSNGWGNNERVYYTNRVDNVTINNDNLLIIAKKERHEASRYTSARMKTKFSPGWTYGKIEARIKLPMGQGIWPAFWMLGHNIENGVGWPHCGEIDIMEHVNNQKSIRSTVHFDSIGNYRFRYKDTLCDVTQYHIYSVEWDQYRIKWFLDGSKYNEDTISISDNTKSAFHRPFFLLLNMSVGGNWPGNPDGTTTFPDTMFVDYVRVYQK